VTSVNPNLWHTATEQDAQTGIHPGGESALALLTYVLSIGRLLAGDDRERYYLEQVGQGRDDYYAGEGDGGGEWAGTGAQSLGASGEVTPDGLSALLRGTDPAGGGELRRSTRQGGVSGFDLTFRPPKSVSLLWGLAEPEISSVVREAHDAAVTQALGYLERDACRGRRGAGGVRQVVGEGFVAAAFRHSTSRAGDPLLHTHVVVGNLTHGDDGKWGALDSRMIFKHAKTAGFLYQAALRAEMTRRLGVEWGPVRSGCADLAGVRRGVIEHFSQRRTEVLEHLRAHGAHSAKAAQVAVLETRRAKQQEVPVERLRDEWRARAAEHGLDGQEVAALLDRGLEELPARRVAPDELTVQASTFSRRDVLQAVAAAQLDGADVTQVERLADELLARPDIVVLEPTGNGPPDPRFTTTGMLAVERGLLAQAEQRRAQGAGLADLDAVEAVLAARGELSDEQANAVRGLTLSGDGVQVLRAPAGTGKTYALDAARDAWTRSNITAVGCALSARAARELEDQAGVDATTIARLLGDLERGYVLAPGSVLVVDEAGMVGSRTLATLSYHAAYARAKLVLVGDDRQLPEIDAGGAFRALANGPGIVELSEVRRQRHGWDRAALDALRQGDVERWAHDYRDHGRIVARATADSVRSELVREWWQAAREPGTDAVMIAHRRADVADLNQRARALLRADGSLGDTEIAAGQRSFAAGDRVVATHNDRRRGVVNGDRGDVVAVDPEHQAVTVRLRRGEEVELDSGFLVEGHLDHGYAVTAHKAQGATVDRAFVLGSDELYREWGYTALSRHREESRFYIVSPASTERHLPELESEPDPVAEQLVSMLGDSHAKRLALDQLPLEAERNEVDPLLRFRGLTMTERRLGAEADRTERERQRVQARLTQLREDRAALGFFARRDREQIDHIISSCENACDTWNDRAEQHNAQHTDAQDRLSSWIADEGPRAIDIIDQRAHHAKVEHATRLDELRDLLAGHGNRPEDLASRDDWAKTTLDDSRPAPEPPARHVDLGHDLDIDFDL